MAFYFPLLSVSLDAFFRLCQQRNQHGMNVLSSHEFTLQRLIDQTALRQRAKTPLDNRLL